MMSIPWYVYTAQEPSVIQPIKVKNEKIRYSAKRMFG